MGAFLMGQGLSGHISMEIRRAVWKAPRARAGKSDFQNITKVFI